MSKDTFNPVVASRMTSSDRETRLGIYVLRHPLEDEYGRATSKLFREDGTPDFYRYSDEDE